MAAHSHSAVRRWGVAGAALALAASLPTLTAAGANPPRQVETSRSEMLYVISAHGDDELAGWTLMMDRPETYQVIVTMTQGEGTDACDTLEKAVPPPTGTNVAGLTTVEGVRRQDVPWLSGLAGPERFWGGPHKYQGPGSPAGQPDKGERHPLGNPWQGQGTQACKDARVASWHWFLDAASKLDKGLPSFQVAHDPHVDDNYVGEFCEPPRTGLRGATTASALALCAKVWRNADGARITFNSPNTRGNPREFEDTRDHTIRAIDLLKKNRVRWGLPALPEAGIVANAYHYEGDAPGCFAYPHPQHRAVQEAIYHHDFGAGPQFGVAACLADPRLQSAELEIHPWDTRLADIQWADPQTDRRIGPYNVYYGWLFEEYAYTEGAPLVWRRFR